MTHDLRDAYFDNLLDLVNSTSRCAILTIDMGAKSLADPEKRGKARVINCGVSEANAVSVAAGLSSRGYTVFVYGISAFLVNRARAQIRHDAVIGNNNVHLIGSGPGLAYDLDGPSHHSLDDIALARTLPGIHIYSPFDADTAKQAVLRSLGQEKTTYCRLDKGKYPTISSEMTEESGMYFFNRNPKSWILSTGVKTHDAMLLSTETDASVGSFFEINGDTTRYLAKRLPKGSTVTILDESHESGGLFQLVGEANIIGDLNLKVESIGLKNIFVQEKLYRSALYGKYSS